MYGFVALEEEESFGSLRINMEFVGLIRTNLKLDNPLFAYAGCNEQKTIVVSDKNGD